MNVKLKQAHLDAMAPKWRQLMKRHPAMFEHRWRPPECAEGWYDLLDQLMTDLETEMLKMAEANVNESGANDNKSEKIVNIQVLQIKEKFGGLRFYTNIEGSFSSATLLYDLIVQAEEKSFKICEICGEQGKLRRKGGWMRTVCDTHYKEWTADGD